MLNKNYTYAIIGASNNKEKYGYKVMKQLKNSGYKAIPINPKEKTILGEKVYKSILDFPEKIDVVIFIVPPKVTNKILKNDIIKKGITKIWIQPGAGDEESLEFCQKNNFECMFQSCIIIATSKKNKN